MEMIIKLMNFKSKLFFLVLFCFQSYFMNCSEDRLRRQPNDFVLPPANLPGYIDSDSEESETSKHVDVGRREQQLFVVDSSLSSPTNSLDFVKPVKWKSIDCWNRIVQDFSDVRIFPPVIYLVASGLRGSFLIPSFEATDDCMIVGVFENYVEFYTNCNEIFDAFTCKSTKHLIVVSNTERVRSGRVVNPEYQFNVNEVRALRKSWQDERAISKSLVEQKNLNDTDDKESFEPETKSCCQRFRCFFSCVECCKDEK